MVSWALNRVDERINIQQQQDKTTTTKRRRRYTNNKWNKTKRLYIRHPTIYKNTLLYNINVIVAVHNFIEWALKSYFIY